MNITPEEYKRHEDVWDNVLDVLIGVGEYINSPYYKLNEGFKKRYLHDYSRFREINYWMKARLFNKFYNEKYEETN